MSEPQGVRTYEIEEEGFESGKMLAPKKGSC